MIDSLEMPESAMYQSRILDYMFRVQEVVAKYVKVYFDFKLNYISNVLKDESQIKPKIIALCKLMVAMTKFIGVRLDGHLKENTQALDLIESTFGRKINWRVKEYLVKIEFWVKRLSETDQQKYKLH